MSSVYILDGSYLIASVTFIIGLKMLSHPDSARRGNQLAAFGMAVALLGTLFCTHQQAKIPATAEFLKWA